MKIIKTFADASYVYCDRGRFDDYCVYLKENNTGAKAPRDVEYFQYFIDLAAKYGKDKIYSDFCKIYDKTTADIDDSVLELITSISNTYSTQDVTQVDKWFSVIYLGMVAEEKKANAILKKKIKRLGFCQIMNENFTAFDAANYSRGKKAADLLKECQKRGF